MVISFSYVLISSFYQLISPHLGKHNLLVSALLISLGYLLVFMTTQFLVPLWGIPPLLAALFILGAGMGLLMAPLLHKTLEEVAPQDAGTASGIFMTFFQIAGALGITLIGLIDAALTKSNNTPLHAFILSMSIILLLSLGLSLTVQPLDKPLPPQV